MDNLFRPSPVKQQRVAKLPDFAYLTRPLPLQVSFMLFWFFASTGPCAYGDQLSVCPSAREAVTEKAMERFWEGTGLLHQDCACSLQL